MDDCGAGKHRPAFLGESARVSRSSITRGTGGLKAYTHGHDGNSALNNSSEHISLAKDDQSFSVHFGKGCVCSDLFRKFRLACPHAPSREQRRVAMEKDMMNIPLSESQKQGLRTRWQQNEPTTCGSRRKVDASAFIKLKTIGHGMRIFSCLFFILAKLTSDSIITSFRRFRRCVTSERATYRSIVCYEAGICISGGNACRRRFATDLYLLL